MRSIDPTCAPNIFDKDNPAFRDLHFTMDLLYRQLRAEGVGAEKHSAEPFTEGDENKLWELGIMGAHSPTSLLRAVFFYNVKNICLRGGEEHRNLKLSQLKRTQKRYMYTENVSKNRQGGISQLKLKSKSVKILENHDIGDRCHCTLLDLYISKLPAEAKSMDLFYAWSLEHAKRDDNVWYYKQPIGRNKLSKMVRKMCTLAKIPGHHTSHSLYATGATALYTAGVPEKIIQERTGHQSIECLRMYEHTNEKQQLAVSKVLSFSTEINFQSEIERLEAQCSNTVPSLMPNAVATLGNPMTFNNCQVNISSNNGPSAPVNFSS